MLRLKSIKEPSGTTTSVTATSQPSAVGSVTKRTRRLPPVWAALLS